MDWRHWCRNSERIRVCVDDVVTVLERFEGHELSKLAAQYFRMTAEVVDEDLRRLLIFSEVTALVEATGARRIHEEIWWPREFDYETARTL